MNKDSTSHTPPGVGAPEPTEIEITSEMLSAGVLALPFFEPSALGTTSELELVSQVFLAMDAVRPVRP